MRRPWPTGGLLRHGGGIYAPSDTVMFCFNYCCVRCHVLVLDHTFLSLTSHSSRVQRRIYASWVNSSKKCAFFLTECPFNLVNWFTKRFRQMMTCLTYLGFTRLQPCLGSAFSFLSSVHSRNCHRFLTTPFLLPYLRLCPRQHILIDFCN